jgi:4-amino-4-deoxy-L-arabinose transferase-like glycosyltransferase
VSSRSWATAATGAAIVCGLLLMAGAAWRQSATYDEVTYLEVATRWWRTGNTEAISRMGSPLTFWKLQQAPSLALLQALGLHELIDRPIEFQSALVPLVRIGSLWIWVLAAGLTALWARSIYGPWAGALAAWLFGLGPNLLAHGSLVTMELPLAAAAAAAFWSFSRFLDTGRRWTFLASAVAAGLAFSCKFTAALIPALLALPWWLERLADRPGRLLAPARPVATGLAIYTAVLLATNVALTGGATLSASEARGAHPAIVGRLGPRLGGWVADLAERPWPQDWVAFATQIRHQSHGGSSYLLGERRDRGWLVYYAVAMAVKLPLAVVALGLLRLFARTRARDGRTERLLCTLPVAFLVIASLGSTRNYGFRYLLFVAPPAVVWLSGLAVARIRARIAGWVVVCVLGATTLANHPNHLSYFNELAGGCRGGRHILADSNLDWGQGARDLAALQELHPALRDLTTYYFGSTDPGWYGVRGVRHVIDAGDEHPDLPEHFTWTTEYVALSASLQWGPWGPAGYFRELENSPVAYYTWDGTIAVYRPEDRSGELREPGTRDSLRPREEIASEARTNER